MSRIAVVVNPISGGGQGHKLWKTMAPGLEALFEQVTARMSNQMDDLPSITQALLEDKPDYLLIIGGDGTLHQALNGTISNDVLREPKTRLAYFNTGCGGDFARQFSKQRVTEFLNRLMHDQSITSNVGKIALADGRVNYFINVASCGFSAAVARDSLQSRWLKKLGGTMNYLLHALLRLIRYQPHQVKLQIDDNSPLTVPLLMMAACNGRFFGGGMKIAPLAKVDDNLLDVVLLKDFTTWEAFRKFPKIYTGSHLLESKVHFVQARCVQITPVDDRPVFVEADGELVGEIPARIELLAERIDLII